jgi:hypothetical protein
MATDVPHSVDKNSAEKALALINALDYCGNLLTSLRETAQLFGVG